MADILNEVTWTGFTKKHKLNLDDGALVKALGRFDKTSAAKPEPRLEALDDLVEQLKKQVAAQAKRKKDLGDKLFGEVKDKLYALLDTTETMQKELRLKKDAASETDEEESPELLTTKMIPLIREVRKGEVVLQSLIAVAGKETVVLLSRKAISPARGKLLKEQMTNPGGLKFVRGECLLEDGILTFVVQAPAAGLAKKIKAALLAQTELRLKVRVRGEDADDVDEEGEDEGAAAAGAALAGREPQANAATDTLKARFDARLAQLEPRLAAALRPGAGDASKLRAVSMFAREKAESGAYAAGLQALDSLEKLLPAAAPATSAADDPAAALKARLSALIPRLNEAQAAGRAGAQDARLKASEAGVLARKKDYAQAHALLDEAEALLGGGQGAGAAAGAEAPARSGAFVDYAKARLEWIAVRRKVASDIDKLEKAILEAYKGSAVLNEATTATRRLDRILQTLDETLADKLDEGLNASDPAARAAINRQAAAIIDRYTRFLHTDRLMRMLDDNPFVPISVQAEVAGTLEALSRKLA